MILADFIIILAINIPNTTDPVINNPNVNICSNSSIFYFVLQCLLIVLEVLITRSELKVAISTDPIKARVTNIISDILLFCFVMFFYFI